MGTWQQMSAHVARMRALTVRYFPLLAADVAGQAPRCDSRIAADLTYIVVQQGVLVMQVTHA
jgi:hypothetical protein